MRLLLFLLALSVLFSGCLKEYPVLPAHKVSGASLSFKPGGNTTGKSADDPWDTINAVVGAERVGLKSSSSDINDDPWDTILESFARYSVHGAKKLSDSTLWWRGYRKSVVFFVSFGDNVALDGVGEVVEVRGRVAKVVFAGGGDLFMVDVPDRLQVGALIECTFYGAASKDNGPFTGVRTWRIF
jgi:hypothetical protein